MIFARYIGGELLRGWLLVLVILSSLFALLGLIEEIDNLRGSYDLASAISYVALTTPQRVLELTPVIAALGTILAFAKLARASEIIVMRSTGMSVPGMLRLCLLPTLVMLLFLGISEEYYIAAMYQQAETGRQVKRSGNLDILEGKGLWSSNERRFFNVRNLRVGQIPERISLYEFSRQGALLRAINAERAQLIKGRHWKLIEVQLKEWNKGKITTRHLPELELGPFWSAEELPVIGHSLASMPPSALYQYANYLEQTGQPHADVRMAFWQKLALPFASATMVLLAAVISGTFGTARSRAFGWRVLAGVIVGAGFYLLTQIIHTGGQMLGLDASIVVLIPIALALLLCAAVAATLRGPH